MKKFIAITVLVIACFSIVWAGFYFSESTKGTWALKDSDGNTIAAFVDNGSTGKFEVYELDIGGGIDIDGTTNLDEVDIDGAVNNAGTLTQTGNVDISADTTFDGKVIYEPSVVVVITTTTELTTLDRYVLIIASDAAQGAFACTSSATPFISTTNITTGQIITIMGTDATGVLTISDNGTVSGSQLELDGDTVGLGLGSNITFIYYDTKWYQVSGSTID